MLIFSSPYLDCFRRFAYLDFGHCNYSRYYSSFRSPSLLPWGYFCCFFILPDFFLSAFTLMVFFLLLEWFRLTFVKSIFFRVGFLVMFVEVLLCFFEVLFFFSGDVLFVASSVHDKCNLRFYLLAFLECCLNYISLQLLLWILRLNDALRS